MVFAHFFLRPAVAQLDVPVQPRLMHDVLGRFFHAGLVASLLTLASGVWMLGHVAKQVVQSGGNFEMPLAWIDTAWRCSASSRRAGTSPSASRRPSSKKRCGASDRRAGWCSNEGRCAYWRI